MHVHWRGSRASGMVRRSVMDLDKFLCGGLKCKWLKNFKVANASFEQPDATTRSESTLGNPTSMLACPMQGRPRSYSADHGVNLAAYHIRRVTNFLSHSVISGFTSGAAITIGLSQESGIADVIVSATTMPTALLWALSGQRVKTLPVVRLPSAAQVYPGLLGQPASDKQPARPSSGVHCKCKKFQVR
jgi:hypothetical protein